MSVRWCGPLAFLVERADLRAVLRLHAAVEAAPPEGLLDAIPAARTLFLRFGDPAAAAHGAWTLALRDSGAGEDGPGGRAVTVDVVYDGEDLEEVAEHTGLSAEALVAAHTGTPWVAAFGGFAPGFFYLTGGDSRLLVPRRESPRTAVPAGAVALAGEFSAVYPRRSPGGWQLIGRTEEAMFDLDREPPALLAPGDTVTFRAARERVSATQAAQESEVPASTSEGAAPHAPRARTSETDAPRLEVLDPGLGLLVQDAGRPGLGSIGVAASGAADLAAFAQANRLVGNPPGEAVLESLLGGARLRAHGTLVLALTGAQTPARIEGERSRPAPMRAPFALLDGETLRIEAPESGLRTYLGVRGGLGVSRVLNSRASDTLSGLGPAPLTGGEALPVGSAATAAVGRPEPPTPLPERGIAVLRVRPGPREDWFTSLDPLLEQEWVTTQDSDRVGVRLSPAEGGHPLRRTREDELASEGVVTGALQVPPNGSPVLFLADHPVTGGYPVVACVHPHDLSLAAQAPPGTRVRFRKDSPT